MTQDKKTAIIFGITALIFAITSLVSISNGFSPMFAVYIGLAGTWGALSYVYYSKDKGNKDK